MSISISCRHFDANLMPEHGGSLVLVVTGIPNSPTMTHQCPYGDADVAGGWRVTIPRAAIRDRKKVYNIQACPVCVAANKVDNNNVSSCSAGSNCACCAESLRKILLEHSGLFQTPVLPTHTDQTLVTGVNPSVPTAPALFRP